MDRDFPEGVVGTSVGDPVRVDGLEQFMASWFGPPPRREEELDGDTSVVPRALVDGYRLISRWGMQSVVSFNHAVELSKLHADDDGMVRFWYESQGCWEWSTTNQGDDPPVYESEPEGEFEPWRTIEKTVTEFLLSAVIFEAALGGRDKAIIREVEEEYVRALSTSLEPIVLAPSSRFMAGVRLLIGPGVLVDIEEPVSLNSISKPDGRGKGPYRVWLSARSPNEMNLFMRKYDNLGQRIAKSNDSRHHENLPP